MDDWEWERQRDTEKDRDRQTEIDFEWGGGTNEYGYINTRLASSLPLYAQSLAHRIIPLICKVPLSPSANPLWKTPYRHIYRPAHSVIQMILKPGKSTMKVTVRNFLPRYLSITKDLPSTFSLQTCGLCDDQGPHFTDVCDWWLAPCQEQIEHLVVDYSFCRIKETWAYQIFGCTCMWLICILEGY